MRRYIHILNMICIAILCSGCIESYQVFTLNPDGSGKVVHRAVLQPVDLNFGEKFSQDQTMRKIVRAELERSKGIEAWTDVTYSIIPDGENSGNIAFEGTAYFQDVNQVKMHNNGFSIDFMKVSFIKTEDGKLELKLVYKEEKVKSNVQINLTEEEKVNKVIEERAKYQQTRPMLDGFFSFLKINMTFKLPGEVVSYSNFNKHEDGSLNIELEGKKFINVVDELIEDDDWLAERIASGNEGPYSGDKMYEKLFGEKGPVFAVSKGDFQEQFDYAAEVAMAKKENKNIFKELGVIEKVSIVVDEKETADFKVGGVRIVWLSNTEKNIRPFNYDKGYSMSIIGKLPEKAISASGGVIKKAIADNGDNLLPLKEWDRKISFPSLAEDNKTVIFEIKLSLPNDEVKGFKEISGLIEYMVSPGVKEVDLGINKLSEGSTGTSYNAVIKSIKEDEWGQGQEVLSLKVDIIADAVEKIEFFDSEGKILETSGHGYSSMNDVTTFEYSLRQNHFPPEGRIVMTVYEDLIKHELPFKIENISLLGRPIN